jgi:hypothetical protein
MDILHEPPPGFEGIANAFAMAKLLPTTHQMGVTIGLVRDGVLFAYHVREQGWYEHLLGGETEMHGCEMLFTHPSDVRRRDEDPSFIRRTAVELWPSGSHRADR